MATFLIASVIKISLLLFILLTAAAYLTFFERRILASIQMRYGPNRVGPFGFLQPLADGVKILFKEQIIPTKAKVLVYLIAPAISLIIAFATFAVIPLSHPWSQDNPWNPWIADINVGILYIFAISSLAVYGIVLGGWSSGNKYSLLGSLRSAAQMISYEVSIGLAIMGVLIFAGTLSMVGIVQQQFQQNIWFIAAQPLGFILYCIAAVAEVNRAPFDLPEAEQELTAGYFTEYSGLRFVQYFVAEYTNMVTVSAIAATLFLGGWNFLPLGWWPSLNSFLSGAPFIWFLIKVSFFLFIFIWMRATLPRIRYDQLMRFGWTVMLPLSALNLLIAAFVVANGWAWWVSGLISLVVIAAAAGYMAWRQQKGKLELQPVFATEIGVSLPSSIRLVKDIQLEVPADEIEDEVDGELEDEEAEELETAEAKVDE